PYRQPPRHAPGPPREDFSSKLDDIAAQLQRLAARDQHTAAVQEPVGEPEADREIVNELLARLDDSERKTAEVLEAVQTRLSTLDEQISQLPAFPERPEDVPGYQALETALRKVVEHIETSENHSREALKSVNDRMGEIAHKAAT